MPRSSRGLFNGGGGGGGGGDDDDDDDGNNNNNNNNNKPEVIKTWKYQIFAATRMRVQCP